jgi:hypothetical protein
MACFDKCLIAVLLLLLQLLLHFRLPLASWNPTTSRNCRRFHQALMQVCLLLAQLWWSQHIEGSLAGCCSACAFWSAPCMYVLSNRQGAAGVVQLELSAVPTHQVVVRV